VNNGGLTQRSQNGTQKLPKMHPFLGKSALFGHPLDRLEGILSWKMIAPHHSQVHPTLRHALSGSQRPLMGALHARFQALWVA
jgi:hypothetical protein